MNRQEMHEPPEIHGFRIPLTGVIKWLYLKAMALWGEYVRRH